MDQNPVMKSYWSQPAADVMAALNATHDGLTADEAQTRLAQAGPNTLTARMENTPLQALLKQFADPIVLILLGATAISAATKENDNIQKEF